MRKSEQLIASGGADYSPPLVRIAKLPVRFVTVNDTHRIKIVVTRRRIVRWQAAELRARCAVCACEVETLACAQAADLLEIDGQVLAGLIAAGRVHTIALVICGLLPRIILHP